MPHLKMKMICV